MIANFSRPCLPSFIRCRNLACVQVPMNEPFRRANKVTYSLRTTFPASEIQSNESQTQSNRTETQNQRHVTSYLRRRTPSACVNRLDRQETNVGTEEHCALERSTSERYNESETQLTRRLRFWSCPFSLVMNIFHSAVLARSSTKLVCSDRT
jgi:hypothetical protein